MDMTLGVLCLSHSYVPCHQDQLMTLKWTTHMHYRQPEFPATVPCGLRPTPESLTHEFSISSNAARIIRRPV